jgi:hypothetical protein
MARDTFEDRDEAALAERAAAGDALGSALVFVTTAILAIAFIVIQQALAQHYGAGMFSG